MFFVLVGKGGQVLRLIPLFLILGNGFLTIDFLSFFSF